MHWVKKPIPRPRERGRFQPQQRPSEEAIIHLLFLIHIQRPICALPHHSGSLDVISVPFSLTRHEIFNSDLRSPNLSVGEGLGANQDMSGFSTPPKEGSPVTPASRPTKTPPNKSEAPVEPLELAFEKMGVSEGGEGEKEAGFQKIDPWSVESEGAGHRVN